MPLVFVHGVNTRRGDTPEEQKVFDTRVDFLREQFRRSAFAERVSAPSGLRVFTPYWGDLGVRFARNLACVPRSGVQALAVGQPPESQALLAATTAALDPWVLAEPGMATAPLLTRRSGAVSFNLGLSNVLGRRGSLKGCARTSDRPLSV